MKICTPPFLTMREAVVTNKYPGFRLANLVGITLIILAVALQLLVTVSIKGTQVRVAMSDILLPLMFGLILLRTRQSGRRAVFGQARRVWKWLVVLTLWLTVALIQGVLYTESMQTWALVNKYIGWYVLIVYFAFGAVVANTASPKAQTMFFGLLFLTSCLVGLADIQPYIETMRGYGNYYRLEGFSGNPNAFGFLLAIVLLVVLARKMNGVVLVSNAFDIVGVGFLLLLIVFTGSRSSWLGLFFGISCLLLSHVINYRRLGISITIAISLAIVINSAQLIEKKFSSPVLSDQGIDAVSTPVVVPYIQRANMLADSGVNHRLEIFENAIGLWVEHPIIGVGLGGYLWSELSKGRTSTIHTSALWLLTETGIVGLLLFSAFWVDIFLQLWKQRYQSERADLVICGVAVLAALCGASIALEAMYQRYVWFFIGWALACILPHRSASK